MHADDLVTERTTDGYDCLRRMCQRLGLEESALDLQTDMVPDSRSTEVDFVERVYVMGGMLSEWEMRFGIVDPFRTGAPSTRFTRLLDLIETSIRRRRELAHLLDLKGNAADWEVPDEHMLVHPLTVRFGPFPGAEPAYDMTYMHRPHFATSADQAVNRLPMPVMRDDELVCRLSTELDRTWLELPFETDEFQRRTLFGVRLGDLPAVRDLANGDHEVDAIIHNLVVEEVDHYPHRQDSRHMVRLGLSRTAWLPFAGGAGEDAPFRRHPLVA